MEITLKRFGSDFLALCFPSACSLCNGPIITQQEQFICSPCLLKLPRERNYNGEDNETVLRLRGLFPFDQAYSFLRFSKRGRVQKLIHKAKYNGMPELAFQMGVWFAVEELNKIGERFEIIVPVPLHPHKLKSRGYNQSAEIARGIAKITSKPMVELLVRKNKAATQTQLSRWERFENTSNEFYCIRPNDVKGKKVLLIDDIITTGATLAGASGPLVENGVDDIVIGAIGLAQKA